MLSRKWTLTEGRIPEPGERPFVATDSHTLWSVPQAFTVIFEMGMIPYLQLEFSSWVYVQLKDVKEAREGGYSPFHCN